MINKCSNFFLTKFFVGRINKYDHKVCIFKAMQLLRQWRIRGGVTVAVLAKNCQIIGWVPPLGNPGSATG